MEQHLFIADTHFGHSNIHEKFRTQFESQEQHNTYIHNNILEAGDKTKTLWILGDSFLKEREFWRLDEYRKKYQQVNLLLGNHCHIGLPRYIFRVDKGGQPVFNNVNVFGVLKKFGFWLSHVPVPDYELYRGNCIHGHLHSKKVMENLPYPYEGEDKRYFCVSCENIDYRPISLQKIKELRGWE